MKTKKKMYIKKTFKNIFVIVLKVFLKHHHKWQYQKIHY